MPALGWASLSCLAARKTWPRSSCYFSTRFPTEPGWHAPHLVPVPLDQSPGDSLPSCASVPNLCCQKEAGSSVHTPTSCTENKAGAQQKGLAGGFTSLLLAPLLLPSALWVPLARNPLLPSLSHFQHLRRSHEIKLFTFIYSRLWSQ